MGRNLYKLTKIFDDVIVISILCCHQIETAERNSRFSRVLAEYLKNSSTDFHQNYVSFRQSYIDVFEIKRLKIDYSLLLWQPIHEGVLR